MPTFMEHIEMMPDVRSGKPCIKNTRITVGDILKWLGAGMSTDQILEEFPQLNKEDILAAINFAAYRDQITIVSPENAA